LKPRATGIAKALRSFSPNVVLLNAYNGMFWLDCLAAARFLGIPVAMRHEASDVAIARSRLRGMMRGSLLRLLYSQIAGFGAIGVEARRHLLRLGIPDSRIGSAPYCVDTEQIERQVREWVPRRNELRGALRIAPADFVVLFSGKLIEKKQPLLIPEAARMLPESLRARVHLIVMGDGEQRTMMEDIARNEFGPRLHMLGFVNQSEMGRWYAAADCLVLPSKRGAGETWGLVVNESLQFGLSAVVSDGVGCHSDLIDDATGCIFPSGSAEKLASVLVQLDAESTSQRKARAEACRRKIDAFSVRAAAAGLSAVLLRAAGVRRTEA
jgi:glycosyltransferase involved in cell wall biosynthesis